MQWMWRKRMDDAMDVDNGYVRKRRAKKKIMKESNCSLR